jgi:hypothetical protein
VGSFTKLKLNKMKIELKQDELGMIYVLCIEYLTEHKDEWIEGTPHIETIKSLIEKLNYIKIK